MKKSDLITEGKKEKLKQEQIFVGPRVGLTLKKPTQKKYFCAYL